MEAISVCNKYPFSLSLSLSPFVSSMRASFPRNWSFRGRNARGSDDRGVPEEEEVEEEGEEESERIEEGRKEGRKEERKEGRKEGKKWTWLNR